MTLGVVTISGNSITFPVPGGTEDEPATDKVVGRKNFTKRIRGDKELQQFLAEEISRIMAKEAKDEDVEILQQNPFN